MSSFIGGALGGLGGGAIGSAVVNLSLDSSKYQKDLATAQASGQAATSKISGAFQSLKANAGLAFAAVGAAAVAFVGEAVKAAIEAEEVQRKLEVAIGGSTKAFEDQATALQDLTGFSDEAILSADTLLTRFELTEQQIRSAIPTVLDYARATGTEVPAAAQNIGKALLGSTRALKTVGIEYEVTGNRAQDFTNILELLNDKVGGTAAAFGNTAAGQLAIFSQRLDEVKEDIGAQLLPVIVQLADAGADLAEILGPILGKVIGNLAEGVGALADIITPLIDKMVELGGDGGATAETQSNLAKLTDFMTSSFGDAVRMAKEPFSDLADLFRDVPEDIDTTAVSLGEMQQKADLAATGMTNLAGSTAASQEAQDLAAEKIRETNEAIKDQQNELEDLLTVSDDVWAELADQAEVTSREIINAFNKQIKAQQDYSQNFQELVDRKVPDQLLQQLSDLGLEGASVIEALANTNDAQWNRIVDKWVQSGAISKAQAQIITDAMNSIPSSKDIHLGVIIRPTLESGALAGYNSVIRDAILSELQRVTGT